MVILTCSLALKYRSIHTVFQHATKPAECETLTPVSTIPSPIHILNAPQSTHHRNRLRSIATVQRYLVLARLLQRVAIPVLVHSAASRWHVSHKYRRYQTMPPQHRPSRYDIRPMFLIPGFIQTGTKYRKVKFRAFTKDQEYRASRMTLHRSQRIQQALLRVHLIT